MIKVTVFNQAPTPDVVCCIVTSYAFPVQLITFCFIVTFTCVQTKCLFCYRMKSMKKLTKYFQKHVKNIGESELFSLITKFSSNHCPLLKIHYLFMNKTADLRTLSYALHFSWPNNWIIYQYCIAISNFRAPNCDRSWILPNENKHFFWRNCTFFWPF